MRVRIARVRASGTRAGGWVRGVWAVCPSQVGSVRACGSVYSVGDQFWKQCALVMKS